MRLDRLRKQYERTLKYEWNYSITTIKRYSRNIARLEKFLVEQIFEGRIPQVQEIQTLHIRRFLAYLSRERQCLPSTVKSVIDDFRAFFKYAQTVGQIKRNPMARIVSPRLPARPARNLTVEEVEKLFSAVDCTRSSGQRDLAVLKTLYYTGLRASELGRIKLADFEGDLDVLTVCSGKGGKDRKIPVHSYLKKSLKDYLAQRKINSPYLFVSNWGRPLSNYRIANIVKKYVRKAGLPEGVTAHTLRHTFASHLVQHGTKINYVGDLSGHESLDTTSIYTHYTLENLVNLILKLGPLCVFICILCIILP